jgi:thiol:disulfide interchange protein
MSQRVLACVLLLCGLSLLACDDVKRAANSALGRYRAYAPEATLGALLPAQPQKPLLLVFGGNWCVWCKALDEQIKSDDRLAAAFANFTYIHVDSARNEDYSEQHGDLFRAGFPLLVKADARGQPLAVSGPHPLMRTDGQLGFDVDAVVSWLNTAPVAP